MLDACKRSEGRAASFMPVAVMLVGCVGGLRANPDAAQGEGGSTSPGTGGAPGMGERGPDAPQAGGGWMGAGSSGGSGSGGASGGGNAVGDGDTGSGLRGPHVACPTYGASEDSLSLLTLMRPEECAATCVATPPAIAQCIDTGCLVVLASCEFGLARVALDATSVYWTHAGLAAVMKVSVTGGKTSTLASDLKGPNAITVDGTHVYWANAVNFGEGSIMKTPLEGGTLTTLVSGLSTTTALAVDASHVYWASSSVGGRIYDGGLITYGGPSDTLMKVPLLGGTPLTLAGEQPGVVELAVDGTSIYWTTQIGSVAKAPLAGGLPTILAAGQASPSSIAVDSANVYWADGASIGPMKVPLDGGTATNVCSARLGAVSMAFDGTNLYWVTGNSIVTVPRTGGTPVTLVTGLDSPGPLAVHGNRIAWIENPPPLI